MNFSLCTTGIVLLALAGCAVAPTESTAPAQPPATAPPAASASVPATPTADVAPAKATPVPVPQVAAPDSVPAPAKAGAPADATPVVTPAAAPAAAPAAKPVTRTSPSKPKSSTPSKPAVATTQPAAATAPKPAAAPALDLAALEQRLRDTKAIGLFTKLSIKNQVDDLLDAFRAHFKGQAPPLATLRQRYDLLLMKVLSTVQDGDPPLASDIASSREAIWQLLNNPANLTSV